MKIVLSAPINVSKRKQYVGLMFLKHYSRYPISEYFLSLNGTVQEIEKFKKEVSKCSFLDSSNYNYYSRTEKYTAPIRNNWLLEHEKDIKKKYTKNDWKFTVDSDEFFFYDPNLLDSFLRNANFDHIDAIFFRRSK